MKKKKKRLQTIMPNKKSHRKGFLSDSLPQRVVVVGGKGD
jgi:hypothetical protein